MALCSYSHYLTYETVENFLYFLPFPFLFDVSILADPLYKDYIACTSPVATLIFYLCFFSIARHESILILLWLSLFCTQ